MAKRDHKRLIEESDFLTVVNARNYSFTKKGRAYFLYCPQHEKKYFNSNKSQSNCYFYEGKNICFCTVCQETFTTKTYIELAENISFGEAYDILWEIMGKPEWYKKDNVGISPQELTRQRKNNEIINTLGIRLSKEGIMTETEKNQIIQLQKTFMVKRMESLNEKFKKNLFKKELEILKS